MIKHLKEILTQITLVIATITIVLFIAATIELLFSSPKTKQNHRTILSPLAELLQPKIEPYKLTFNKSDPNIYYVYLAEEIHTPNEYSNLVTILEGLGSNNTVKVYLNGYGGSSAGMLRLITALDKTAAKVVYIVDGDVYSAHAILACDAHRNNITPGIYMMFHSYSSGSPEKGSDALKFHIATTKSAKDIITKRCSGILSPKEIDDILNGVDVYKHF